MDDMYGAGSDDFRGYIWKIPPLGQLTDQRQTMSADEWMSSDSSRIGKSPHFVFFLTAV